jgi:hypothetical protein
MSMPLNKKSIPCGGLVGKTFGRLTVEKEYSNKKYILCECSCSCGGKTTSTRREGLLSGRTQSCGCIRKERSVEFNKTRFDPNAISKSVEYRILTRAKSRAKQKNIPFNLTLEDIEVPETCPLLGIPIEIQPKKGYHPNSPSLDKIIPEKGYIKGNVWVISNRANTLKNDATLQELKTLVENLEAL